MTTIYRTEGEWGPGKGLNLTEVEVDQNFYGLEQRIGAVENNPPQPVSIDHFVIEGTLMTIVLTDGTEHGPFVMPVGQWRFTGPWMPVMQYFVGDIVTNAGNTYFVRVQHISEETFDPGLFGPEGEIYVLIMATPATPFEVVMPFYAGIVADGSGATLSLYVAGRDFTIPGDLAGVVAALVTAPSTTPLNFGVNLNDTVIGTVSFEVGWNDGTAQGEGDPVPATIDIVAGDWLWISQPIGVDPVAAGLAVTIPATVPPSIPSP